jgi:cytochrome c-type biogenesis protein CcmH/NrfF
MGNVGAVVVVVIVLLLIVYNRRRRARMTPEQRLAEDQVRATREVARELRRSRRY